MSIDMSQFYQVFFEEAAEHLASMETLLLGLDVADPSMDDLNAIFRAAHSIKGGAGTFGFNDMTEVTHVLETLLDKLRKKEMTLTDEMVNAFLEAGDAISMQLAAHRGEGTVDAAAVSSVREKLVRLSTQQADNIAVATIARPAIAPVVVAAIVDDSFGFFDDAPGVPADALGVPVDAAGVSADAAGVAVADDSFGFFDDAPGVPADELGVSAGARGVSTPASSGNVEAELKGTSYGNPGYGFFTETPVQRAEREKKQGYGIYKEGLLPLPDVVPDAVTPSASAVPATNAGRRASDKSNEKPGTVAVEASIRVSTEKVDQLINLMGEIVITQAMLAQAASGEDCAENENLQRSLHHLERNTRDLQEAVMSIRMLPISFVFSRFPRLVRDLAGKLNKQVDIKMVGETTELDKSLIEKIADPLTHLVRNSMDHGIEMPDKRVAAGKNPCGTITLKAYHQGGNVVIEVSDDGGGLNRARILKKAHERGMDVRDDMSDQEIYALIMEPGFSTAEVVTDVSGRGVGMDVVRRNIADMGGRVELDSIEGWGSRVIIRLPLTLAILDGLSVSVGNETYIVPLNSIIESMPGTAANLKTITGGNLLQVRGEYLSIISLHSVFNIKTKVLKPEQGILILLEASGKKIALLVDELIGQHQVVLKSLESNFRKVNCISGATIMGDGHVALILDAAALVRMGHEVELSH